MIAIHVTILIVLLQGMNINALSTIQRQVKTKDTLKTFNKIENIEGSMKAHHVSNPLSKRIDHRYESENTRFRKKRKRYAESLTKVGDISLVNDKFNAKNYSETKLNTYTKQSTTYYEGLLKAENTDLLEQFKSQWPVESWSRYGLFSDDYLLMVNRHWLQFPPPPRWLDYTLGVLYVGFTIIGCSGNAIVLFMYFRCRSLRTPGNILVANLALSDFLMLAKTPIFIFNSFNLGPALGKIGCTFYGFVGGLSGTTSIATLAAIALDRYWAVVRPLEPLRALTAVRARLLAAAAWVYAGAFAAIPALDLGFGRYVPEGYLTSCSFDYLTDESPPKYFIFAFFCAAWLAPFCTISFCYVNILRVVVYSRNVTIKNQQQQLSSRHIKEQTKRRAEVKLAVLVIVVIALFFVSWTPYAVVALLGIFGRKDIITPTMSMVPALFCKTAACINPFIYIITHPNFQRELCKMLNRETSKRSRGTLRTTVYNTEVLKHRPSKDLSDTEVEMVEVKDIPYHNNKNESDVPNEIKTLAGRVGREGSQRSISLKSFEEEVVSPPSWFAKPNFSKRHSFQKQSTKSVVSINTDLISKK